ncbi:hypothetical protein PSPO01_10058 [Paraphaeosphaeria sporulosa]
MRRIHSNNSNCAILVFIRRYVEVLSGGFRIETHGSGARKAEEASEGIKASGYRDPIVEQADENGVGASDCAGAVLRAPPVKVPEVEERVRAL